MDKSEQHEQVHRLIDGALEIVQSDPNSALAYMIEAKRYRLSLPDIDYVRGLCFIQLGKLGDAREALLEELRHFPDRIEVRALLEQVRQEETRLGQGNQVDTSGAEPEFLSLLATIRPYSMLPDIRLYNLYLLARQVCQIGIPGDFVECGVAGGGSTALLAAVIKRHSSMPRCVYALDTFEGMPPPTARDTLQGVPADQTGWGTGTCRAPTESVKEACVAVGADDLLRIHPGLFENSIPPLLQTLTGISLLHVDCDWYESALTVLGHLYDRVHPQGFIQFDDYGYWQGIEQAVAAFAQRRSLQLSLHSIDGGSAWMMKNA